MTHLCKIWKEGPGHGIVHWFIDRCTKFFTTVMDRHIQNCYVADPSCLPYSGIAALGGMQWVALIIYLAYAVLN